MIFFSILITCQLYFVLILSGETLSWSLMEVKGSSLCRGMILNNTASYEEMVGGRKGDELQVNSWIALGYMCHWVPVQTILKALDDNLVYCKYIFIYIHLCYQYVQIINVVLHFVILNKKIQLTPGLSFEGTLAKTTKIRIKGLKWPNLIIELSKANVCFNLIWNRWFNKKTCLTQTLFTPDNIMDNIRLHCLKFSNLIKL